MLRLSCSNRIDFNRREAIDVFIKRSIPSYADRIISIALFGSVARSIDRPDSDVDLLVAVDKEDFRPCRELIDPVFGILLETCEDISVKVLYQNDFEAQKVELTFELRLI